MKLTHMYYIAIVCPPIIDEKVLHYKNWMKEQFGCIVAQKSRAHITMIPPFWLEETKQDALLQTLESFQSPLQELEISLDGFSHFGKRVLFIQVKKNLLLSGIKKQTEDHFIKTFSHTIKPDERDFHPHITIANRDLSPSAFTKAWEYLSGKEFRETFATKTISLLKLIDRKWQLIGQRDWVALILCASFLFTSFSR